MYLLWSMLNRITIIRENNGKFHSNRITKWIVAICNIKAHVYREEWKHKAILCKILDFPERQSKRQNIGRAEMLSVFRYRTVTYTTYNFN